MAQKKESFFWTSYSDLMTSLFFIMLTLFVLVIVLLHKRMETTEHELEAIKEVINSTKELNSKSDFFDYKSQYKKYVLNVRCFFPERKTDFIDMQTDTAKLHEAGDEIRDFLRSNCNNQYMMIIEGQASRNSTRQTFANYDYSFKRALTLMGFWKDVCHIDFGNNCEIQIAGSGDGRYNFGYTGENDELDPRFIELDNLLMREKGDNEVKNQRFVIHIIPKNIIEEDE